MMFVLAKDYQGCDAVITLNPVNRDILEPHFINGLGWEAIILKYFVSCKQITSGFSFFAILARSSILSPTELMFHVTMRMIYVSL